MGFALLGVAFLLLGFVLLQWRGGVTFGLLPHYRDSEPFLFWGRIALGTVASVVLAGYGVKILLQI